MCKLLFLSIYSISFTILLDSCTTATRYAYSPATNNLLQPDKKGDLKLSGSYTAVGDLRVASKDYGSKSNGLDFQGVYALSRKIAVGVAGYKKWESNNAFGQTSGSAYKYRRTGAEISTGIYNFSKTKMNTNFRLFAGVGVGSNKLNGVYPDNMGEKPNHETNQFKAFLQPVLHIDVSKNTSFSLSSRINVVHFYNIKTNIQDLDRDNLIYLDQKNSVFQDFVFQETFFIKGAKGFGFHAQQGITTLYTSFPNRMSGSYSGSGYDYHNFWVTIGLVWRWNK